MALWIGIKLKFIDKYIPSRESVENHRFLRTIRHRLQGKPYLWEFKQATVVKATWVGVFWAMMPMPFQMLPAVLFALLLRANILVAVAWVWLSNPLTMLPILYASYFLGCKIFGVHFSHVMLTLDYNYLLANWRLVLGPLVIGSIAVGIISSLFLTGVVWLFYQLKPHKK